VPSFGDRMAIVSNFLPEQRFDVLRAAIHQILGCERSFVPMQKKSGTIAYSPRPRQLSPSIILPA
jgi:hypothetical protein